MFSRFVHIYGRLLMLLALLAVGTVYAGATAEQIEEKRRSIIGSKHDLTSLNTRAGAAAMGGVAYDDYGDPCVYCHLPSHTTSETGGADRIRRWNRLRPVTEDYIRYESPFLDSPQADSPGDMSLLCLSCHDGSMAVDRIVSRPATWTNNEQATLHMSLNVKDDLDSCGKCHDGRVAHDISTKVIGTDHRDLHPISIPYAGLILDMPGFKAPANRDGFVNGVRLYNGMIECATCHDIHKTDSPMLLRTSADTLCLTCHNN